MKVQLLNEKVVGGTNGLPTCPYRTATGVSDLYFCEHTLVRIPDGLVSASVCQQCTLSATEAPATRKLLRKSKPLPKRPPGLGTQAWNFVKSMFGFVADGMQLVSQDTYQQRLAVCNTCDSRRGDRCMECGCGLSLKARGRAFECPLNKWDRPSALDEANPTQPTNQSSE